MLRILLFFVFVSGVLSEPQCSRFHYEEQTLNKIIRMEIAMEKLQSDMMAVKQQVMDVKEDWQNEKKHLERSVTEMKEEKAETDLEFNKKMERVKGTTVAFRSQDVADLRPGNGDTLVFKTTMLNEGLGYDNTSGLFTAPSGGNYLFAVQLCVEKGSRLYFAIYVNGVGIEQEYFYDTNASKCYNANALVKLKARDIVQVKSVYSSTVLYSSPYSLNTFSGVLVHS